MFVIRGRGRNLRLLMVAIVGTLVLLSLHLRHSPEGENDVGFIDNMEENDYMVDFKPRDNPDRAKLPYVPSECREKRQFVYIKMIKCGSTTLANMFRMFVAKRGLSCVLPLENKIYLGWPYQIQDSYFRPSKTGQFDVVVDHAIYNRTRFSRIMPEGTIYITSIREPFSQFKSMFNYYNLKNITGIKAGDPIKEYLNNIDKYETLYQAHNVSHIRHCIPDNFTMTRNLMSLNLGFPSGWPGRSPERSDDVLYIEEFLRSLDHEFHLVLISEYMPESLILLRRLMCWKLSDILHVNQNVGNYTYRRARDPDLIELYKERSNVDFMLYDYFNRTLWRRIKSEGSSFQEEVSHFRQALKEVSHFCFKSDNSSDALTIRESRWNEEKTISKKECKFLGADENFDSLKFLKDIYDKQVPIKLPQPPKPPVQFC